MPSLLARLLTRSFPAKAEARGAAATGPDAPGVAEPPGPSPSYESRAFRLWLESRAGGKQVPAILDLGRLHPDSLEFFQSLGARVAISSLDTGLTGTRFEMQLDDSSKWAPFDGILCWDVPNYLATDELKALGRWLARVSESGTMVMVCLATHTPYPDLPGQYAIQGEATLRFLQNPNAPRTRTVVHSSHELVKLWPQFAAVRSFLLRSGMQEFVLRRR